MTDLTTIPLLVYHDGKLFLVDISDTPCTEKAFADNIKKALKSAVEVTPVILSQLKKRFSP